MALLELVDFHYYYGNIHSVKGVNMYVDQGEMVTLIGSNGAGKTTTMQSISGLTKRRGIRGKIIFEGK
ncbi:MAG: ATP-binding cassette domain-containing protein, partial [Clostridia bacterium]|nr:ATP-binding cassette domain-containing protein [Clostridia bacterium]